MAAVYRVSGYFQRRAVRRSVAVCRAICLRSLFVAALLTGTASAFSPSTVHVWEKNELTFTASRSWANPYAEVTIWVNLVGPGFQKRVFGFWDGDRTFRVRVLAPAAGRWKWQSGSNPPDPGLSRSVRFGMRAAALLPRAGVRLMLSAQGRGSDGMTDDICRVGRPWGFSVDAVAASTRVVVWHPERDPQVPVAPWRRINGIELHVVDGDSHEVPRERWETALRALTRDDGNC